MAPARGIPINGAAIQAIRQAKGWNGGKFAIACGISPGYLSNIEAGRKVSVSPEVAKSVTEVLGVPLAAITSRYLPEEVA